MMQTFHVGNHLISEWLQTANKADGRWQARKILVEDRGNTGRIFAPLRDRIFFSLEELNEAIWELLDKHNHMLLQGRKVSRWDLYQKEKQALIPLPAERFEINEYRKVTVMKNSHIRLSDDKHYYSVPDRYIGEKVKIAFTSRHVSVYHKNERIAIHLRDPKPFGYTTIKEHLPSTHQFVAEWNPDMFIVWARKIDPQVEKYIKQILGQKVYPEQSYRRCTFSKNVNCSMIIHGSLRFFLAAKCPK